MLKQMAEKAVADQMFKDPTVVTGAIKCFICMQLADRPGETRTWSQIYRDISSQSANNVK